MKTITLTLRKRDIFNEIGKSTAYTGAKSDSDANNLLYDRVAIVEEDTQLLDRYCDIACSELLEEIKEFVTQVDFSGENIDLTLETSGFYDDSLTPSLQTDLFAYLVASISMRWFRITLPGRAAEQQTEAARMMEKALSKLYHRRKPTRRSDK